MWHSSLLCHVTISVLVVVSVPIRSHDCVAERLGRPSCVERSMHPIRATVAAIRVLAGAIRVATPVTAFLHPSNIGPKPVRQNIGGYAPITAKRRSSLVIPVTPSRFPVIFENPTMGSSVALMHTV